MKKGFTLIELLVVVLIIGILSAIALPQYQLAVWKSRYATMKPLVKAVAQAEEAYYLENNTYTPEVDNLGIDLPGVLDSSGNTVYKSYFFSWGRCTIYHNKDASSHIECLLLKGGEAFLSYAIYFQHAPVSAGTQYCGAFNSNYDLTSIQERICRNESGLSAPVNENSTGYGWPY